MAYLRPRGGRGGTLVVPVMPDLSVCQGERFGFIRRQLRPSAQHGYAPLRPRAMILHALLPIVVRLRAYVCHEVTASV